MQFKPCYITSENIDKLPFNQGQIILTTDKKGIYFDAAGADRIPVSATEEGYMNAATWTDNSNKQINYIQSYTKQQVDDITGDLSKLKEGKSK